MRNASDRNDPARESLWRDRLRPFWEEIEWFVVGGAAAVALILGYVGFDNQPHAPGATVSRFDHAYHSLQLWWLEYGSIREPTNWQLDVGRLLAPAVLLWVAGKAIWAIFREQIRLLRPTFRKRVLICGLGTQGWLLAKAFQARNYRVAMIEQNEKNNWVKACRDRGIPVVVGDATDTTRLRKARLHKATYLIAVCGKDGTNADVAVRARDFFDQRRFRRRALTVYAHVVDLELCRLLRNRVREAQPGNKASSTIRLFNIYETGTRMWLRDHPPFPEAGEQRDGRPHLVVVGVGRLGRSLVAGAATDWLARHPGSAANARITIVDRDAYRRCASLVLSHPELEGLLVPVRTDVAWPKFEEAKFLFDDEGQCDVTTIYVCLDDDVRGVAAALALLERIRQQRVPIVVRTVEEAGLAGVLEREGTAGDDFEPLRTFPLLDRVCVPEQLFDETVSQTLPGAGRTEGARPEAEAQVAGAEQTDRGG